MPTNFSVNDGKATPIAHVFTPIRDGSDALYVNESSSSLQGQETMRFEVSRPAPTQTQLVRLTHWNPQEVVVDGVVEVPYGNSFKGDFKFAPKATKQHRLDTVTLVINTLQAFKQTIADAKPHL